MCICKTNPEDCKVSKEKCQEFYKMVDTHQSKEAREYMKSLNGYELLTLLTNWKRSTGLDYSNLIDKMQLLLNS